MARPAIRIMEPETCECLDRLGQARLRTEFWVCGREVFESFDRDPSRIWDRDPTPLLMFTAFQEGFGCQSVDLGYFQDDDGRGIRWGNFSNSSASRPRRL